MFLPLLASEGYLMQGSLTVGHQIISPAGTVTVYRGYAPIITSTPGSFSGTTVFVNLTGLYQYLQSGAGSDFGIVLLCDQLPGISTVQVSASNLPDTWRTLTWNGSDGYSSLNVSTFGWSSSDTGTVKSVYVRAA